MMSLPELSRTKPAKFLVFSDQEPGSFGASASAGMHQGDDTVVLDRKSNCAAAIPECHWL
jgi:hypothetical protein